MNHQIVPDSARNPAMNGTEGRTSVVSYQPSVRDHGTPNLHLSFPPLVISSLLVGPVIGAVCWHLEETGPKAVRVEISAWQSER
jgi:hypothetical protein